MQLLVPAEVLCEAAEEFKRLPEDDKRNYMQQALTVNECNPEAVSKVRDSDALWGQASEQMPQSPELIEKHVRQELGLPAGTPLPGVTDLVTPTHGLCSRELYSQLNFAASTRRSRVENPLTSQPTLAVLPPDSWHPGRLEPDSRKSGPLR